MGRRLVAERRENAGSVDTIGGLKKIEHGELVAVRVVCAAYVLSRDENSHSGPLFRPIDKEGHIGSTPLALRTITQIFRTRAEAAGIGAEDAGLVGLGSVRLGKILAVAKEHCIEDAIEAGRSHPESAPRIANLLRHHDNA
ncbi:MAG: site-specific integrase [Vulcanimicrobiaceae bacterium]